MRRSATAPTSRAAPSWRRWPGIDPAAARPLLEEALRDREWAVRVRAATLLQERDGGGGHGWRRSDPPSAGSCPTQSGRGWSARPSHRTPTSRPTRASSRSSWPCWTRRRPWRTSSRSHAGLLQRDGDSPRRAELRRAGRRHARRRRRRARLHDPGRDQHAARTCEARSGWRSTGKTRAAASSSSPIRRSRTWTVDTRCSVTSWPEWRSSIGWCRGT